MLTKMKLPILLTISISALMPMVPRAADKDSKNENQFNKVPNEIVHKVIEHAGPENWKSINETDKRFHAVSSKNSSVVKALIAQKKSKLEKRNSELSGKYFEKREGADLMAVKKSAFISGCVYASYQCMQEGKPAHAAAALATGVVAGAIMSDGSTGMKSIAHEWGQNQKKIKELEVKQKALAVDEKAPSLKEK